MKIVYQDDQITKVEKPDGTVHTVVNSAAPNFLASLQPYNPTDGLNQSIDPSMVPDNNDPAPDFFNAIEQPNQPNMSVDPQFNQQNNEKTAEEFMALPASEFNAKFKSLSPEVQNVVKQKTQMAQAERNKNPDRAGASGSWGEPDTTPSAPSASPMAKPTKSAPAPSMASQPDATDKKDPAKEYEDWFAKKTLERKEFLDAEYKKLQEESKIDPNRVLGSTRNKIVAGIAMAFGGLGQGLMRSNTNQAMETINRIIDNDISSQKQNAQNKQNMYSELVRRTGDDFQAESLMKMKLLDFAQDKLKMEMDNKFRTEGQKIEAQKAAAYIENLKVDTLGKMQESVNKQIQRQAQQGMNVDPLMRQINALPEEYRKEAIKEYGLAKGMAESATAMNKMFDDFSKIGAIEGSLPFSDKKAEADTMRSAIVLTFAKALGGNPSEPDRIFIEKMTPVKTDTKSQILAKKTKILEYVKMRQAEMGQTPTLELYGIKPQFKSPEDKPVNNDLGVKPRGAK